MSGWSAVPAAPARLAGWRGASRVLGWAFGLGTLLAVVWLARRLEWRAVGEAIQTLPAGLVAAAAAAALLSHVVYSCYDLLGRAWVGHRIRAWRVMLVTFVSYAFNLNLGSLIGGIGLRLRLYTRLGLRPAEIGQVFALSLVTNWLGYAAVAGGVFLFGDLALPADWPLSRGGLAAMGLLLWLIVLAYLVACAAWPRREMRLRGRSFSLPGPGLASAQLVLSCLNWGLIAGIVALLLERAQPYDRVLGVHLLAVVAGLVLRVPGGLGVLESVYILLMAPPLARHTLLAALLAYRAVYYVAPLLIAAPTYLLLEAGARRAGRG